MKLGRAAKTRLVIMDSAKELFREYGVRKVIVEDIIQRSGISRATFYNIFVSKYDCLSQMMIELLEDQYQKLYEIIKDKNGFHKKIEDIITLLEEFYHNFSFNEYTELSEIQRELDPRIKELDESTDQLYINFFIEYQKKGIISDEIKPEFLLYCMKKYLVFSRDPKLLTFYDSPIKSFKVLLFFYFYGIKGKP